MAEQLHKTASTRARAQHTPTRFSPSHSDKPLVRGRGADRPHAVGQVRPRTPMQAHLRPSSPNIGTQCRQGIQHRFRQVPTLLQHQTQAVKLAQLENKQHALRGTAGSSITKRRRHKTEAQCAVPPPDSARHQLRFSAQLHWKWGSRAREPSMEYHASSNRRPRIHATDNQTPASKLPKERASATGGVRSERIVKGEPSRAHPRGRTLRGTKCSPHEKKGVGKNCRSRGDRHGRRQTADAPPWRQPVRAQGDNRRHPERSPADRIAPRKPENPIGLPKKPPAADRSTPPRAPDSIDDRARRHRRHTDKGPPGSARLAALGPPTAGVGANLHMPRPKRRPGHIAPGRCVARLILEIFLIIISPLCVPLDG
jgi:hypothetical protein